MSDPVTTARLIARERPRSWKTLMHLVDIEELVAMSDAIVASKTCASCGSSGPAPNCAECPAR